MYENGRYTGEYGSAQAGGSAQGGWQNESRQTDAGNTYHYEQPEKKPKKEKKNGSGNGKKVAIAICCGLLFGIFAGIGYQAVSAATGMIGSDSTAQSAQTESTDTQETQSMATPDGLTDAIEESSDDSSSDAAASAATTDGTVVTTVTDVTEVVKEVMPAVVSVNNTYVETSSFFGQQYSQESSSCGSGIIVGENDTELLIATNNHVVQDAEELTVQFVDGNQVTAQIKGTDSDKDLAVIAVQLADISSDTMSSITIATLGDSDSLTVGEPVIAIGNALGYGQSVTTGVVSALNRAIAVSTSSNGTSSSDAEVNTFIQTDAAINPGNSGGALLNIKGEVIGINSNKIGGSTVEGMGYAIPISDAKPIIEDLMTKQTKLKVSEDSKGYLGITGIDVVEEYSQIYGMPQGVYVSSVTEGTGAAAAGLVKGDIITALNGETVESMEELKEELSYYAVGTTVELTIMQGSPTGYQAKTVEVTLGSAPTAAQQ